MCFVLEGPLVSTLPMLVSTCCPKTAQKVFWEEGPLVSTLPVLVSTCCPKTAQKATSVDTTCASVDTLSQLGQKVFWELSLVSTLPGLEEQVKDGNASE
ncbi:hypothetical protein Taro_000798 [Colocasia esculenta]|uniref:Uncharacterized protein n=1 Tax=Colocasia esculenta TaxID=4460 RepID=A0A843THK0_COLES|nr:hypothetical protein [Colocasia esculenta]